MTDNQKVVLFQDKEQCCGCGACQNVCPKQAISMKEDEYGFVYPQIDSSLCVMCGACRNVCAYRLTEETNTPICSYAAVNTDRNRKLDSASGGIFASFADAIIDDGGVVFGCALDFNKGSVNVHHVRTERKEEVFRLQGSKYVQSSTGYTYKEALELLKAGRKVIYSGTPCQIAGLKRFLGKDYDNLILVDLICHGVPSERFFTDYLSFVKSKHKYSEITGYSFRDKKKGWGINTRLDVRDRTGKNASYYSPARLTSYNTLFLDGLIYRKNCYTCKYAGCHRPGDITIGDFWGIMNEHPEILNKNGFDESEGISCMIVNTPKGQQFIDSMDAGLRKEISQYEKIAKENDQLNHPFKYSSKRDEIMDIYVKEGYKGVEDFYLKRYYRQRVVHFVFNKLPRKLRMLIKKIR